MKHFLQSTPLYRKFGIMQLFIDSFLRVKVSFTIPLVLLLGACTTPGSVTDARAPVYAPSRDAAPILQEPVGQMNDVALYALSQADTPYRYGGNSLSNGFDCSGFVQFVYLNARGIKLPRTTAEMSMVGEKLDENNLQPGDLVFFNTKRQPFSHVGIYVGEERFVHAPSSGKAIMVANMREKYWQSRYNGARRIVM